MDEKLPGAVGVGEWEVTINDKGVSIWGDEKVMELDSSDGCIALKMHLMLRNTL